MPGNYSCVTDFACAAIFFCTLRYIVRQRAYVIYDAIIYSKRPLLRLRPLASNNELSTVKAHYQLLTDMVDGSCTELAKELLSAKCLEVVNGVRPQVKDIIARKTVSLFHHDDTGS